MNESILNHLFLPHYLPTSATNDFLIESNHQNEHQILLCMKEYFDSMKSDNTVFTLPIISVLADCIQRWSVLQSPNINSVSSLKTGIEQLPLGSFLPLYFHAQNAAILIEIDGKNKNQPLISSWQVSLPMTEITSSLLPHFSCFPVATYRLENRSQLSSKANCELLMDFMANTLEYSKSCTASQKSNEIRDVPESHYVCQWWIQQFQGLRIENNSSPITQFMKKHRDQIRCNGGSSPFRRSGLWMTIKVVLHTILAKHLGECGTLIYKLLITHFLTYMICQVPTSADLLVHGVRKIVRRLNKIENKLWSKHSHDVMTWIQQTKQDIQLKINQLLEKSDWQTSLKLNSEINRNIFVSKSELDRSKICQHSCQDLKAYLRGGGSIERPKGVPGMENSDGLSDVNQADYIPSYKVLTIQMNYTTDIALIRMEIWIELCLKEWINRSSLMIGGRNRFEILLRFFEDYQNAALSHYYSEKNPTDPIGYSRFVLTSLTIICFMHEKLCNDPRFELLKQHSINIANLNILFEYLVLPNREDMIRARMLYDYFCQFNNKPCPDLLTNIESVNAFGVHFASQTLTMIDSIQQIRVQAEYDKQQKIQEVNNAKARYRQLMDSVSRLQCSCDYRYGHRIKCKKCLVQEQANSIKVYIFEHPLPSRQEGALAVIFELQMPIEIRSYRDIIWQFINRPKPNPKTNMREWLSISPHAAKLGPFYTGPSDRKVRLVSPTKSTTENTSSALSIVSRPIENFVIENSLPVQISSTSPVQFKDEHRTLTPQLEHLNYKQLQFTLDTTQFVQNEVIANLSACSLRLRPTQFVEFGSFRSGHRLQWRNLLAILEMDSLSIAEESVAILILHSILQYGPFTTYSHTLLNHWCSESHQSLLDDYFIDEMISRLDHHLNDCELNWQNELVLVVIAMVTVRMLTICNSTKENKVAALAIKCRKIGEKWIDLISESIQTMSSSAFDEVQKLRLKLVNIGVACILTFSANKDRITSLLSSSDHVLLLMKASTTVHDNIVLNKNQISLSTFMRNMMRYSERVLVLVQPTIAKFLEETLYITLNEFAEVYWAVIKRKGGMNGEWKKQKKDSYDGCYECQYESRMISINFIKRTFLVDGMTIGFLPENITSNKLFTRVFGTHVFEVQAAETPKTYITKRSYHGDGKVQYEFYLSDKTNQLIITERHLQTTEIFQLIPHSCFIAELPDAFVSNHSHWLNKTNQIVEFRPVSFKKTDFLENKPYVLSVTTGLVTTNETNTSSTQTLITQSSSFFRKLFSRYFSRLDDNPYVYMMSEDISQPNSIIHIHLFRLGIAFRYNTTTDTIISREYPDMCIDKDQWLGSLTGLTFGLLLSPLSVNNQKLEHYPYRKVIVPFGEICIKKNTNHQIVSVQRPGPMQFSHQYFVFIMNDRLKILQSTDSPTGWLYLALLHAMTSHPFPDEYTGMTGMERAFQLLYSAGCWSDQPFDALSLNILTQIAAISPRINYYPEGTACTENIQWKDNGLPYSIQHFGYYLIVKDLINSSQQLNFMYSSSSVKKASAIFDEKAYNETLLKKFYYDYRDSYNPLAHLSAEMEAAIFSTPCQKPYLSTSEQYSHTTNCNAIRPTDDLYRSGSVCLRDCSRQNWLPLSQWLSSEDQLRSIWIGLLKMTDFIKTATNENRENVERFETLMNFLHYISSKLKFNPFYLQLLKTVLKIPDAISRFVTYPSFISYSNIEEISFRKDRIHLSSDYSSHEKNSILTQAENCFYQNSNFYDVNDLATRDETDKINSLFRSWRDNKQLRSFLETVQNRIFSVAIELFHSKVTYYPQQFVVESLTEHHQIQLKITEKLIDQNLFQNAEHIFHHPYSEHFHKSIVSLPGTNRQNQFPNQIFTSINSEENPTYAIGNKFLNQLEESWKKLLLDKQIEKEDPSIEKINNSLNNLRKETTLSWNELVKTIKESNAQLFGVGLVFRITPTTLVSLFQEKVVKLDLTDHQRTLLGGILVSWTLEQRLERALYYSTHKKLEDFQKEMSNIPHSNWTPSEHIPWLILELEMNITIREVQIRVAQHMMQPNLDTRDPIARSIVMQMNMGEGKTSVILPMLAVSLSSSSSTLVRIIVLKSLFPTNYQSLRYKLGGILNRRVVPFACRRDMNFNNAEILQISDRLEQGLKNCDIILLSPEDILSFDLLTIDKCRLKDFATGCSMLTMQHWLKKYTRDILDESDEILHVKYQLIYTVGGQQQVDAGVERWITIQSILELVKKHAEDISIKFNEDVCYKSSERKSTFPQFRLQSQKPFSELCENLANAWIETKNYRQIDREIILQFLLQATSSIEDLGNQFSPNDVHIFLIIRGLLSSEVLLVALKKRYRVNYGVNPSLSFNRLIAVPFRAKDVVADRTEFGHPDVALVLTHISYYYSGLNDLQLIRCFDHLIDEETDPSSIYEQWIFYEDAKDIPSNIRQWKGVNLKDYQQRTLYLFPTFRSNMLVINYFLNHFVFPREAKQFPHRLVSSAWDLASSARSKIITGFSGTNDTQMLLPVHIRQQDLPELQKTDAIVVNNLLQPENERYQSIPINASLDQILNEIINNEETINVILDVGALFIDGSNREIAIKWLNLSNRNEIDYVVYFDSDSIVVCDRQYHCHRFETSPASERLDHCIFYLDEIHTRGTDFKFPRGFRGLVTLGTGLTKDRFVQACMRMRKLGNGHSLTFWSSNEVHQQIKRLKNNVSPQNEELIDILRWVYENTVQSTWDGLHHWAAQSLSFQKKLTAFRNIQWNNQEQIFNNTIMEELAQECLEAEIIELKDMYGASKELQTVHQIHSARYQSIKYEYSTEIREAVLSRLKNFGGTKQRLSQLLDEEQQRELEQELEEERQMERPPPVHPCEPILHKEIKRLSDLHGETMNLDAFPEVFQPIDYAFTGTTFVDICQPNSWQKNLWISTEFQRVISTAGESLNPFLRPPRWIVVYRNEHIIFVSAYEANWLIGSLRSNRSSITTLRVLLPRIKRIQSIMVNNPILTVPPSIAPFDESITYFIPNEWLVQLFIFNGTLYFEADDEQTAYCQCLALCPKPRTEEEDKAFEAGLIAVDGFVSNEEHRKQLQINQACFTTNPLAFLKQIIENRNNTHASLTSHVGSIILNAHKIPENTLT